MTSFFFLSVKFCLISSQFAESILTELLLLRLHQMCSFFRVSDVLHNTTYLPYAMGLNPMQSRHIIQKSQNAFAISRDFSASKFEFNWRIAILENTYLVKWYVHEKLDANSEFLWPHCSTLYGRPI